MTERAIRPNPDCPDYCLFVTEDFQKRRSVPPTYDVCGIDCWRTKRNPDHLDKFRVLKEGEVVLIPDQRKD